MASSAAKAARRAEANQRLESEVRAIAGRLDLELPAAPRLASGDPDLAAIQRVEHQADVLAAIRDSLPEKTQKRASRKKAD